MNTRTETRIPAINQPWPQQGGIYTGSRLIGGVEHHVVIADSVKHDIKKFPQFQITRSDVEAGVSRAGHINGFTDWRAPDQEDLQLAFTNCREHFSQEMWDDVYITQTPFEGHLWTLDFETGTATNSDSSANFRLRVVRHVVLDSTPTGA